MSPRRHSLFLALALLAFLASGCGYTYHFRDGEGVRGEEHREWASYFLFGIVGEHEIDVREFCGANGTYEVTTGTNFLTWFVSAVTLGIYTPRKVNIWCNAPAGSAANANANAASFSIDLDSRGKPSRVTKRVGGRTYSGEPRAAQPLDNKTGSAGAVARYSVALQEGGSNQ